MFLPESRRKDKDSKFNGASGVSPSLAGVVNPGFLPRVPENRPAMMAVTVIIFGHTRSTTADYC
jgi:hypothetical protein